MCKASGVELACVRPLRHVRVPTNEKDDVASWSVRSFVLSFVTIECSGCNYKHREGLAVLFQCRLVATIDHSNIVGTTGCAVGVWMAKDV